MLSNIALNACRDANSFNEPGSCMHLITALKSGDSKKIADAVDKIKK